METKRLTYNLDVHVVVQQQVLDFQVSAGKGGNMQEIMPVGQLAVQTWWAHAACASVWHALVACTRFSNVGPCPFDGPLNSTMHYTFIVYNNSSP